MLTRFVVNYVERHQNPWNQLLHLVGVPLTFIVSLIVLILGHGWWALGCFVGGYVLQFVGHAIEGNEAGEVVLVKKWLGVPYQEFMPGSPADLRRRGESPEPTKPAAAPATQTADTKESTATTAQ